MYDLSICGFKFIKFCALYTTHKTVHSFIVPKMMIIFLSIKWRGFVRVNYWNIFLTAIEILWAGYEAGILLTLPAADQCNQPSNARSLCNLEWEWTQSDVVVTQAVRSRTHSKFSRVIESFPSPGLPTVPALTHPTISQHSKCQHPIPRKPFPN